MTELEAIFNEMGFEAKTAHLPEAGVVYAIARTFNLAMHELAAVYQRVGLSAASFNVLMLLKRGRHADSLTQQALGKCLVISPSNMTGLLDRLEKKQLVKRTPGADRRSKFLRITPKGSALLDEVWPHHVDAIKRLTKVLNKDDTGTLLRALSRLRQAVAA